MARPHRHPCSATSPTPYPPPFTIPPHPSATLLHGDSPAVVTCHIQGNVDREQRHFSRREMQTQGAHQRLAEDNRERQETRLQPLIRMSSTYPPKTRI